MMSLLSIYLNTILRPKLMEQTCYQAFEACVTVLAQASGIALSEARTIN